MLITRYVMHRACATFCDFSPLLLLLSVPNYRFLTPILKGSNTLNNTGVWLLIELASLYTVPLSAVNGSSRLTTTSNGQTRPIRKFSNRPITVESNRNGRFEFESNLEASQVPNNSRSFHRANMRWVCKTSSQHLHAIKLHSFAKYRQRMHNTS